MMSYKCISRHLRPEMELRDSRNCDRHGHIAKGKIIGEYQELAERSLIISLLFKSSAGSWNRGIDRVQPRMNYIASVSKVEE
jgi:hypothetical protein